MQGPREDTKQHRYDDPRQDIPRSALECPPSLAADPRSTVQEATLLNMLEGASQIITAIALDDGAAVLYQVTAVF